jgi:hypothetical protein
VVQVALKLIERLVERLAKRHAVELLPRRPVEALAEAVGSGEPMSVRRC